MSAFPSTDIGNIRRLQLSAALRWAMFECRRAGFCECGEKSLGQDACKIASAGDEPRQNGAVRHEAEAYILDCGKTIRIGTGQRVEGEVPESDADAAGLTWRQIVCLAADANPDATGFGSDVDVFGFENGHWVRLPLEKVAA